MKKKIIIALSAMLIFGLVAVVYAMNRTETNAKTAHSCPMKKHEKVASKDKKDSCCGMEDCCKDGNCKMGGSCCKDHDSCPMKNNQTAKKQTADTDYSNIIYGDDTKESCCYPGSSCCTGGDCCKGKNG